MLLWLTKAKRQSRSVRRDFVTFRAVPFHVFNKPATLRWDCQIVLQILRDQSVFNDPPINRPLGLTVYFWRVQLDQFA
jgi:hypothetical protein